MCTNATTESLRLEKTSKIIKSNCQPTTTMPAKPSPEVRIYTFFEHLQGWWLHRFPGHPMPDYSSYKEIFPNMQSKLPLMQLDTIIVGL